MKQPKATLPQPQHPPTQAAAVDLEPLKAYGEGRIARERWATWEAAAYAIANYLQGGVSEAVIKTLFERWERER